MISTGKVGYGEDARYNGAAQAHRPRNLLQFLASKARDFEALAFLRAPAVELNNKRAREGLVSAAEWFDADAHTFSNTSRF